MRLEGRPPLGERLTVVGHPAGLPVTISGGAAVQRHRPTFFSADLDTYQGNSGSPVFNSDRLRSGDLFVEGILVRGESDFEQETPCAYAFRWSFRTIWNIPISALCCATVLAKM